MEKSKKLRTLRVIDEKGPVAGMLNGFLSILQHVFPSPISEASYIIRKDIEKTGLSSRISMEERIKAIKEGFTSQKYFWYGLDEDFDPDSYVSDIQSKMIRSNILQNSELLYDKKKFHRLMEKKDLNSYIPDFYGIINEGKFEGETKFWNLLEDRKKLVMKPSSGNQGRNIFIIEKDKDQIKVNGLNKEYEEVMDLIKTLDDFIITEYTDQADFLENIYPKSGNSSRILTLYPENEEPYLAHAYLRIGTKKSGYVDNIHRGGITADIDLETGELSSAADVLADGNLKWYKAHPNTGTKIKGFTIPNWDDFKSEFLSVNEKIDEFKCVAWDIIFTGNGNFKIIEGNNKAPGLRAHQIHNPLLEDSKVRKFFSENGISV